MLTELTTNPIGFLLGLIALVIAITVHEFAHAFAAERLGDPTPRLMGRLTLNPLAHLDPLGTIMLLVARFGWGKPVQFDPFNLRNPRRDSAIISIAGPISNMLTAGLAAILLQILFAFRVQLLTASPIVGMIVIPLVALLQPIIIFNVILAIFNLVPVHPLDGFKIVGGLLPEEQSRSWHELERYGMIFLLFLIIPFNGVSTISKFISPAINFVVSLLIP